jgi:polyhydroxyalkanoate synthase
MESMTDSKVVNNIDRMVHGWQGRLTSGQSPSTLMLAYFNWMVHLANSPGKRIELVDKAVRKSGRLLTFAASRAADSKTEPCIEPLPQDHRFDNPAWQRWPFVLNYQTFLLGQQWWHHATTGIEGVSPHHEEATGFAARQWLDVFSPSNYPWSNPEVLQATTRSGGGNLIRGSMNLMQDWGRSANGQPPIGVDRFPVGEAVPVTPGKVVYRNQLIELLQYRSSSFLRGS